MNTPIDPQQLRFVRDFIIFVGHKVKNSSRNFEAACDLSPHEFAVLSVLGHKGPQAVKEIASHLPDISLSTLTRVMDSLESSNYIKRNLDTNDRRSFVITPTDKAAELAEHFAKHMESIAEGMLIALTPAERLMLLELLSKMYTSLRD